MSSSSINLILLVVIGVVFLIEFILKKRKIPLNKVSKTRTVNPEGKGIKKEIVFGFILLLLFSFGFIYFFIYTDENVTDEPIDKLAVEEVIEEKVKKQASSEDKESRNEKRKNQSVENIEGCWSFYYSWSCKELREGTPYCFNNDGTFGDYKGDNNGTWEIENNYFSNTFTSSGTIYTGIYKNGIIEGKIITLESEIKGCFKMIKKTQ